MSDYSMPKQALTRSRKPRDREAEEASAKDGLVRRVTEIVAARHDGSLGDDHIKLAQVLIMCSLPHSKTSDTHLVRKARLGDGTTLAVTFTAMRKDVPLPYGRDRKLLAWILDRAIQQNSSFVPWGAASEYQKAVGGEGNGRFNAQLRERFSRISSLGITIDRVQPGSMNESVTYSLVHKARLPKSITGPSSKQQALPGMEDEPQGMTITPALFDDIRRYHHVLPRRLWQLLNGPSQIQDLVLWMLVRCFAAASESLIPWDALKDQFSAEDSNPWRLKARVKEAVKILNTLWAEATVTVEEAGIRVQRVPVPLLPDDPEKGRKRRLGS